MPFHDFEDNFSTPIARDPAGEAIVVILHAHAAARVESMSNELRAGQSLDRSRQSAAQVFGLPAIETESNRCIDASSLVVLSRRAFAQENSTASTLR